MRKIVILGECALDIVFRDNVPEQSYPAGRLLNASAILGSRGHSVTFVGECARDRVGDLIVSFLDSHGVATTSIDRYAEGVTPLNLFFSPDDSHPDPSVVLYRRYPIEKFDTVWPRIDSGDIIVFGTAFSFDARVRPRLQELVNYARSRGAVIIYLPGFLPEQAPRITRIMPAILENLEVADLVVARNSDLVTIFGDGDTAQVYKRHISFYTPSFISVDAARNSLTFFSSSHVADVTLPDNAGTLQWNAQSLVAVIETILDLDLSPADVASPTAEMVEAIAQRAALK